MFNHKTQNSKAPDETPETAYLKAQEEYTRTLGSAKAAAANWRAMAFSMMLMSMFCLAAGFYFANRSNVVPYIVEVDGSTGTVISTSKVYDKSQASRQTVEYFIWQIIKKTRTLPKDIIVYERNWTEAYAFLNSASSQKMNDMALREKHQESLSHGITTMLTLKNITPLSAQDDTYNVRWSEVYYDNDGTKSGEYELEAYFTMQQVPADEKTIYVNPLGLKVKDFSISGAIR